MPRGVYDRNAAKKAAPAPPAQPAKKAPRAAPEPRQEGAGDRCHVDTCRRLLDFNTDGMGGEVATCPKGHPQPARRASAPPLASNVATPPHSPRALADAPCKDAKCPGFGVPQSGGCKYCERRAAWASANDADPQRTCEICTGSFKSRSRSKACPACRPIVVRVKARQRKAGA